MNGDDKEEAPRPRPLSAGIWTLFSWLRRSERSSSSESVSSVGSARTAVSFDFLAPGNYNFTNTPIVLTTPLSPPTETYKKRLQERNLRRQRDRDVTLHRKYGLFREFGNGYDGYTLPAARRLGNTVDRPNRDRRATSESLPRRAAYVPGKRRAPLPPTLVTSASLPRTYKRKRPAPKPPIKNTLKNNNNINQSVDDPVRMTSNPESEANFVSDYELLSKNKKCDKKGTNPKDTKSRTDKSFLKHIFENKKRNSVIETSVRLLPSISELDKQATEIIESKKLKQKINSVNHDDVHNLEDTTGLYEGNSWFCTSCLRKYSSTVDSCNYCAPDKKHSSQKNGLKVLSQRSSIYTQTNKNAETETSSRNSMDERKVLKEILKEMKDSLPKKNKNDKVNNVLTEIPTLRIGSTVQETYKDITPQPSSSSEGFRNKHRISISSLIPENQKYNNNNINDQHLFSDASSSSNVKNFGQYKISSVTDKTNIQSVSTRSSLSPQKHISSKTNESKEENNNADHLSIFTSNNRNKNNTQQINVTTVTENKKRDVTYLRDCINVKSIIYPKSELPVPLIKINHDSEESNKNNLPVSHEVSTSSNILLGNHQHIYKDKVNKDKINNSDTPSSSTSAASNVGTISDLLGPKLSKLPFSNSNSNAVVVNTVTVLTAHSSSETSTKLEPENNLHTPLKISSLLNPVYIPNKHGVKEKLSETQAGKYIKKESTSTSTDLKTINIDKKDSKVNEDEYKKVLSQRSDSKATRIGNDLEEPQKKETKKESSSEKITITHKQNEMPSTSGSSSNVQSSNNNKDNLDHYDRRRHLINQLEQSIAKGDEMAAAEAAVKLAKLRLSCSVLSFSSQIVGETFKTQQNESVKQQNFLDIKAMSSKDKPIEQNIPEAEAGKKADINSPLYKNKLVENNQESKKLVTDLCNEKIIKSQLDGSEPSSSKQVTPEDIVPINVWIEDKQAARGPIRLNISRRATVADLRRQAEHSLGLATQLQRWIVGRTLCSDDTTLIVSLAGPQLTAPFYLCIVQPDNDDKTVTKEVTNDNKENATGNGEFYTELMNLEKQSLVPNIEPFECGVCMEECAAGAGVILRECIHSFCRECLSDVVQHCQEAAVACPAMGCTGFLQEREIRTIVSPEEYERWLARGLATAECGTRNAFHCRTRDCTGWAFCDPGVRRFPCPVCKNTNCVQCQAIHEGETCEQYQTKLRQTVTAAETNKDDEGTQALLNTLISKGEALECPECKAIITKKWGCDWVKCSACKTEICWVTKGRRWGPAGRGDTSGGCRCGVDGQRCHPSCGYCH